MPMYTACRFVLRLNKSLSENLAMKFRRPAILKLHLNLSCGKFTQHFMNESLMRIALQCGISGLVISNTTVLRPETLKSADKSETGGLSGTPLKEMSTNRIKIMYRLTKGILSSVNKKLLIA